MENEEKKEQAPEQTVEKTPDQTIEQPGAKNTVVGTSVGEPTVGDTNTQPVEPEPKEEVEPTIGQQEPAETVTKRVYYFGDFSSPTEMAASDKEFKTFVVGCKKDPVLRRAVNIMKGKL